MGINCRDTRPFNLPQQREDGKWGQSIGETRAWGRRYFLMLSAEPAAKEYSCGCAAMARMLFLWYVSVLMVLPFRRSHILIVLSWLPVMICSMPTANF